MMGSRRPIMNPAHILRRLFAIAALLAIGLAPGAASADLKPWNQEEVTELAKTLHVAVKEVRQSMRRESTGDLTGRAKARLRMLEILKVLEKSCGQLVGRLEAGDGRDETLNIARKIRSLVRDAETEGRKFMTTQQTDERIEPAEAALASLALYYFEPEAQEPAEG
jgi:hypothetical protein